MSDPVCATCNDTHVMALGGGSALCTSCPVPCQHCRQDGRGPFCEITPCSCTCHRMDRNQERLAAEAATEPPDEVISAACEAAKRSPCAKSKRGVVAYRRPRKAVHIVGEGYNGPPRPFTCANPCKPDECAKICQHAELRALFAAASYLRGGDRWTMAYPVDLVHVKIDALGFVQPGGPPSCWQCSRAILDTGAAGIWLYEGTRTETLQTDGSGRLTYELPAAWRYYDASTFHEITAHNCGLHLTAPVRPVVP